MQKAMVGLLLGMALGAVAAPEAAKTLIWGPSLTWQLDHEPGVAVIAMGGLHLAQSWRLPRGAIIDSLNSSIATFQSPGYSKASNFRTSDWVRARMPMTWRETRFGALWQQSPIAVGVELKRVSTWVSSQAAELTPSLWAVVSSLPSRKPAVPAGLEAVFGPHNAFGCPGIYINVSASTSAVASICAIAGQWSTCTKTAGLTSGAHVQLSLQSHPHPLLSVTAAGAHSSLRLAAFPSTPGWCEAREIALGAAGTIAGLGMVVSSLVVAGAPLSTPLPTVQRLQATAGASLAPANSPSGRATAFRGRGWGLLESRAPQPSHFQPVLSRAMAAFAHPDHSFTLNAAVRPMLSSLAPLPGDAALTMHAVEVLHSLRIGLRFAAVSAQDEDGQVGTPGRFQGCTAMAELGPFPGSNATLAARVVVEECTGWMELSASWNAATQSWTVGVEQISSSGTPTSLGAAASGPSAPTVVAAWRKWSLTRRQTKALGLAFSDSAAQPHSWLRVGGALGWQKTSPWGVDHSEDTSSRLQNHLGWVGEVDDVGLMLGIGRAVQHPEVPGCRLDSPYARPSDHHTCVLLWYSMDSPVASVQPPSRVGDFCSVTGTCASNTVGDASLVASDASSDRLSSVLSTAWSTKQADFIVGRSLSHRSTVIRPSTLTLWFSCGFSCAGGSRAVRIVATDTSKILLFDGRAANKTEEVFPGASLATLAGSDHVSAQLLVAAAAESLRPTSVGIKACIALPHQPCDEKTTTVWRVRVEPSPKDPTVARWPSGIEVHGIAASDVDAADIITVATARWQAA